MGEPCEVVKVLEAKKKKKKLDPFIKKRRIKGAVFGEYKRIPLNWEVPEYMKSLLKNVEKPTKIFLYHRKAGKNIGYQIAMEEKKRREKKAISEFRRRPYFKTIIEEVKGKPRGKENLDRIKFPCWCSYSDCGKRHIGIINRRYSWYMLFNIDKQLSQPKSNAVGDDNDLEKLMKDYDIEILKGELKLFKEVGEYTETKE